MPRSCKPKLHCDVYDRSTTNRKSIQRIISSEVHKSQQRHRKATTNPQDVVQLVLRLAATKPQQIEVVEFRLPGPTHVDWLIGNVNPAPCIAAYVLPRLTWIKCVSYLVKITWIGKVNPALCIVGVLGNSMNVIVMTRRRVRSALDGRMERAARVGLLSLTSTQPTRRQQSVRRLSVHLF